MTDRWFRGSERGRGRVRHEFDPVAEGDRFGLTPNVSLAIWRQVRAESSDSGGRIDEQDAQQRFRTAAARVAARGGWQRSEPGRLTRVGLELGGGARYGGRADALANPVPGRTTRVITEVSGGRARFADGEPGRTTLAGQERAPSGVRTPEESLAYFRRVVEWGRTEVTALARAISTIDHSAALHASCSLQQHLKSARAHLANCAARDDDVRHELAELEQAAEVLLAKAPTMSRAAMEAGSGSGADRWERWDREVEAWNRALGGSDTAANLPRRTQARSSVELIAAGAVRGAKAEGSVRPGRHELVDVSDEHAAITTVPVAREPRATARSEPDAGAAGGRTTPEIAQSRFKDLHEQAQRHERVPNEVGEGQGFIATRDDATKLAVSLGYPSPPRDHYYLETEAGGFQLQRSFDSDVPPHHITQKDGRPYVVPGPVPSAEAAIDVTALRVNSAAWLAVEAERVVLRPDPTVEHVSVRPPSTPEGSYEIYYRPGMSEADIQTAVERHRELAARRPERDAPRTRGTPPWSFADEAAYRGTQHARRVPEVPVEHEETARQATVKSLVKAGLLDDALDYICNAYGYTAPNMRVVVVDHLPDGAWAYVEGGRSEGAIETMSVDRKTFSKDYALLVRTIGHEYQHVLQRSQKEPIMNQDEREFLAWAWEALDPSGPQYDGPTAAAHARNALDPYFEHLPDSDKKKYADLERRLQELSDRYPDPSTSPSW